MKSVLLSLSMANAQLDDSSSSSSTNKFIHEVFLSFNGKQLGNSFVDFIHIALDKKGFKVYEDNDGKERDDRARKKLYEAIERSRLSIVVISTGYVQSPWCLEELVKILECKKWCDHKVLPVFYNHMEPVQVGEQKGPCEAAFAEHQQMFPDQVDKWRRALAEIATLAVKGLSLRETNWYRAPLRQNIMEEVWKIVGKRRVDVSVEIYGSEATAESICKWMEDVVKIWNQSQVAGHKNDETKNGAKQ